jgi:hypothetical protein
MSAKRYNNQKYFDILLKNQAYFIICNLVNNIDVGIIFDNVD